MFYYILYSIGDFILVIYNQLENLIENENITHNVSIGIAAGITAYSRILMSEFKNNPDIKLFYTDTDSTFVGAPLPEDLIGKEIGLMKLENICKKVIFLSPKVYCILTQDDKLITKVKGLKS